MKHYKFSVKDRVKTDLFFVYNFLTNREIKVDKTWLSNFCNAYDEYYEGMRQNYSVVSGKSYGVLQNALNSVDMYRIMSARDYDEMVGE